MCGARDASAWKRECGNNEGIGGLGLRFALVELN